MKCSALPHPVSLLKIMLNLFFAQLILKGENSADLSFMKCMFNIGMFQYTGKLICFKRSIMLNATKLYSLIAV